MKTELVVKNVEAFEKLVENGNFEVSTLLVDAILKNISTKKNNIYALSVTFEDTQNSYDITLNRRNFLDILKKNLYIQEKFEKYELCAKILKAIKKLEKSRDLEK